MSLKRTLANVTAAISILFCADAAQVDHPVIGNVIPQQSLSFSKAGKYDQILLPKVRTTLQKETTQNPVTITINSTHDPSSLMVWGVFAYNENGIVPLYGMTDSGQMDLNPGTYDFCVRYSNFTQDETILVIKEEIDVSDGTSLTFDPSEATNLISFTVLDENGTKLEVPECQYVMDSEGNWNLEITKDGNCKALAFQSYLIKEGVGSITGTYLLANGAAFSPFDKTGVTKTCGIISSPATFENEKLHTYFTDNGLYLNNLSKTESSAGLPNIESYPGLLPFSYFNEDTKILPGSSAPALCFKVQNSLSFTALPYFPWDVEYRGILGELRTCDLDILKPVVKYGGQIQDVNDYDQLYYYPSKFSRSEETELKVLEVELTVDNFTNAGLPISNHAKITMDMSKEDYVPPTLRMLQLRDDKETITNTFAEQTDINISATAGDFNFELTTGNIISEPITCEFNYAPKGSSEWSEIDMNEDTEYSSANYGYFYKGTISNLKKGNYDLKIILTDTSGNTQEQVITNAIIVEEGAGIDNFTKEETTSDIMYDLMGNLVENPQKGSVYIRNGKKIVW